MKMQPCFETKVTNMDAVHLNELAGRIEGIGRTLLLLIDEAAHEGVIERHDFTARLRQLAAALDVQADHHLPVARLTMQRAAVQIERGT
ncbi:hypothetical protein [Methylobacillus flagellatus]|uniref:Uncharacterized protein n=1 Tax=Methylobacillus flagellatus (strain ATCC 51484 / DSM 6875 / VKM B-1610 / KT) TaxID=265072 RepID=Q1GXR2_METFK|nr:hypothetical protein [Methylobacillus flagellatus]ABE50975.1 hypothetical protein Mfla_2712 [Methylobacillus flagellatus KT]